MPYKVGMIRRKVGGRIYCDVFSDETAIVTVAEAYGSDRTTVQQRAEIIAQALNGRDPLRVLLDKADRYNNQLNDPRCNGTGEGSRPPSGDDYNELLGMIEQAGVEAGMVKQHDIIDHLSAAGFTQVASPIEGVSVMVGQPRAAEWESIPAPGEDRARRIVVPGGWLYHYQGRNGVALAFVPTRKDDAEVLSITLRDLANLASTINNKQHAGNPISPWMWSDLHDLCNRAKGLLQD